LPTGPRRQHATPSDQHMFHGQRVMRSCGALLRNSLRLTMLTARLVATSGTSTLIASMSDHLCQRDLMSASSLVTALLQAGALQRVSKLSRCFPFQRAR